MTSGGSFGSSPLMQHIGLGKATRIDNSRYGGPGAGAWQTFSDVRR